MDDVVACLLLYIVVIHTWRPPPQNVFAVLGFGVWHLLWIWDFVSMECSPLEYSGMTIDKPLWLCA